MTIRKNKGILGYLSLLICSVAVYICIFSGKISINRLLQFESAEASIFGQLKVWVLLVAILCLCFSYGYGSVNIEWSKRIWRYVAIIVVAQLILITHAVLYPSDVGMSIYVFELAYMAALVIILGAAIQIFGMCFIRLLFCIAVISSTGIVLVQLWLPETISTLATSFTIYRVAIFGGFAALSLALPHNGPIAFRWVLFAPLSFSLAYLTLSKAALIAGTGALLFLAAVIWIWYDRRRAITVVAIACLSVMMLFTFKGTNFGARVAEGLLGQGYQLKYGQVDTSIASYEAFVLSGGEDVSGDSVSKIVTDSYGPAGYLAQVRLAELIACKAEQSPCSVRAADWEESTIEKMFLYRLMIPDFSFRVRLLLKGLGGFMQSPWWGNGQQTFYTTSVNLYTAEIEPYHNPHNIIVELLYGVGIIGTALIFLLIFMCVAKILRDTEGAGYAMPMIAFTVAIIFGSVFGGDYTDFRLFWYGLLLAGAMGIYRRKGDAT